MSNEVYKCKKCGETFPNPDGLSDYRSHCLRCKVDAPDKREESKETKNSGEDPESSKETQEPKEESTASVCRMRMVAEAKEKNSCRGYFENDKDAVCVRYASCDECWAHFGE